MTLRAFIADDEPLARQRLRDLLSDADDVECVGEAADGPATVAGVNHLHPDLLFLDIRMPGATGLEVLDQLNDAPHVIFTTAYDQYAVTAFELQALDYLLKPFGDERFFRALARAKNALEADGRDTPTPTNRAKRALLTEGPITRIFVRERGRIVPIAADMIELLEGGDDYTRLYVEGRKHLISVRLRDLDGRLDPDRFRRVHRSYIVNLDFVESFTPYDGTRLQITLKNGNMIIASRSKSKELRRLVM